MSNPKSKTTKPCGCIITEMDDESVQVSPCVPCGMMEIARALQSVAQIFGAVSTRMKMEKESEETPVGPHLAE